ncbi:dnaJ domain-containing protein [Ditylenchus destructor]|nr:dnaJ domain-containing protein [Ditylenchus destructor]
MGIWDEFFEKAKGLFGNEEVKAQKRCYYELLEVDKDAGEDEIKRAYKKLALKWHPDKNQGRVEECNAYFILLQQAYEVLSDPQERAFYDKHRENFIYGGDGPEEKNDTGVNLDPYFEKSCYQGSGDDENGFYAIYRGLFHKLAAEEYPYIDDIEERSFPVFGKSDSDYDNIVDPFYAFWLGFYTRRSFAWLDKWDMRQSSDRATARAMEKENMKLREIGQKQRSEEIRRLVTFVRKQDKRVKMNRERLEQKRLEQMKKAAEQQKLAIKKNLENLGEYNVDEEARLQHAKELEEIEKDLDAEYGTIEDQDDWSSDENSESGIPRCIVCEKTFKSIMAYNNHQRSRKHKQMVQLLRQHMKQDDQMLFDDEELNNESGDDAKSEEPQARSSKKKKCRKADKANLDVDNIDDSEPVDALQEAVSDIKIQEQDNKDGNTGQPELNKNRKKKHVKTAAPSTETSNKNTPTETVPKPMECSFCMEMFDSKTKLHQHLRDNPGHATIKFAGNAKPSARKANQKSRK